MNPKQNPISLPRVDDSVDLSVVIPCYNEEERIGRTLEETLRVLSTGRRSFELIIVDDGSLDQTLKILEAASDKNNSVKFLPMRINQGKGAAVREGMLSAKGQTVLFMDADLATPLSELEKILLPVESGACEVAIGSRVLTRDSIKIPQPWVRSHVTGPSFRLAARLLVGLSGLWDLQCGFKAFAGHTVRPIFSRCRINRYCFDVEALVAASSLGYRIEEIAVDWADQKGSKVNILRDAPRMGLDLLKIRSNIRSGLYRPSNDFSEGER